MTDENQELETSEESQEQPQEDKTSENDGSQEQSDDLSKKVKELDSQRKHWKDKYKKAQEQAKAAFEDEEGPSKQENAEASNLSDTSSNDLSARDILKLKKDGYSDDEILELDEYSQRFNVPIKEIMEDDIIKAGIEKKREKAKVDQATPAPSKRSGAPVNGKTWSEMNREERVENFEKIIKGDE